MHLMSEPLSSGSLEKAAASASLALAVLNDAVPKFCVQEAQALGVSIRRARDRGEDVGDSTRSFARLLQALQDQNLATAAQRLVEPAGPWRASRGRRHFRRSRPGRRRRSCSRHGTSPAGCQRIEGKARDASSAARLMAQVRAAISEDRRYGTPEEEIEQLWAEVDRLTQEKKRDSVSPPPPRAAPPRRKESEPAKPEPEEEGAEPHARTVRPSFYSPYVPPEERTEAEEGEGQGIEPATGRGRIRPRPRA